MARRSKKIKVLYKHLGKHKVWGWAYKNENTIELDSRLKGKKHLEILLHESLHILFPELNEEQIIEKSISLTNTVWNEDYRRIDNSLGGILQDGSN